MSGFPRAVVLLLLLVGVAPALAREDDPAAAVWPADTSAQAELVAAAHASGDPTAFERVAAKVDADTWMFADILVQRGHPDAAVAFALSRPGPDAARLPDYLEQRRNRGDDRALRGAYDAARRAATRAEREEALAKLEGYDGQGDAYERVLVAEARGLVLRKLDRPREAAESYLSGGREAERLGWLARASWMYNESGFAAHEALAFETMLAAFSRCATVEKGRGDEITAGHMLMNIGTTYVMLGDAESAERYYETAEDAYELARAPVHVAELLENRTQCYILQGRHAEALAALERARSLITADAEPVLHANIEMSLGTVHLLLKQYEHARVLYERARAVFQTRGEEEGLASALGNIALVQIEDGEFDKAHESLDRSLVLLRKLGLDGLVATALLNKGWAYLRANQPTRAVPLLEEAGTVARQARDEFALAHALDNLGQAHRRLGEMDRALALHQEVVELGTRLQSPPMLLRGYLGLAEDWFAKKQPDRAVRAAQRAMDHALPLVSGLGQEQAADARKQLIRLYTVATDAAVAWESPAALCTAMEEARAGALLEALENRHAIRGARIPDRLREREQAAHRAVQIAGLRYRQALRGGVGRAARRQHKQLEEAQQALQDVVGEIQRTQKAVASVLYPMAATLEEVQGLLQPGEVFVSYSLLGERAVALVCTTSSARIAPLGSSTALREAAAAVWDDPAVDPSTTRATLRALLIDPLHLDADHPRVLISPAGVLGYVPFSALLEKRAVSLVPSGTAYAALLERAEVRGRGVLALGDPDYEAPSQVVSAPSIARRGGQAWQPLPETRKEAKAVGDEVLLGPQATRTGLFQALAKRRHWRSVHLACHGLVDTEQPMRSGLALSRDADGTRLLTSLDVLQSNIPTELAVLSACETGKGRVVRVEGIVGLTQAFMLAGAPRVIVSLWKVDDAATRALMTKFYELWNRDEDPLPAREALAAAQAHVRSQEKWRHPFYWGAWVLWGLPE